MKLKGVFFAAVLGYPALTAAQALLELKVDLTSATAAVPKELEVDDWSRVRVTVTKNMFHSCTVDTKTEALPAPPNPVAQILGVLGPFVGGGESPKPAATERGEAGLEAQIEALVRDAETVVGTMKAQSLEIESVAQGLPRKVACDPDGDNPCANVLTAQARLDTLAETLQGTPQRPITSTTLLASRAAELTKALMGRMVQAKPEEGPWLKNAFERLRWAQENIEYAADRRAAMIKARDALLVIRERIIGFRPSREAVVPATPVGNARMTATVTCVNIVTQQPIIYTAKGQEKDPEASVTTERLAPVSAGIVFRNKPWATVSGGLLYSLVDKRQVGIAAHKTGSDDAGVATFDRRVMETDRGASQVVPFTFLNVVIPGLSGRRFYGAGTVGFGLNPNNGPKTLEYFLGGAFGIGRFVVVNAGLHLGSRMEPDNQFAIGDVLPSTLTAVPTRRDRKSAFALGVSYGLPLPK
jgi:hypothetical protein